MNQTKQPKVIFSLFFFVTVAFAVSPTVKSQKRAITAETILAHYLSACGGSNPGTITTEKRTGTLVKGKSGKVPFSSLSTASGKWYYNQVFAFGDQVSYGYDGKIAWVADQDRVMDLNAREILDLEILFDIRFPQRMGSHFPEMEIKKMKEMAAKEHIVVMGTARDGNQIEMEFDKKTGLLIRFGDITFSDYKKTNGVVRPHKIAIGNDSSEDGLRLMMEIHNITFNEPVDEKIFSIPCCPLRSVRAPLFTRRKQISVSEQVLDTLVAEYRQVDKSDHIFIIKRQGGHLMMKTPRSPYFLEIKPETELDYFIRFLNVEVHFIRNDQGMIDRLEIGREHRLVAKKINPK